MTASSITIVTKSAPQSYTGGTSAAAKGTVLSVLEVDSNFINLKEGIINVETDLTNYVNSTFITALNANLTGIPTAPTPAAGAGNFQIQTVGGVSALVTPISTLVNSSQTGNLALQSFINFKAPLASPAFTGFPQLSGATYNFASWDAATSYLSTVEYVQDKLINLTGTIKPATAGGVSIGTSTEHVNELHVNTVLPAGANATIGTPTNRFTFGYFDTGDFGPNTILVGSAEISANGATLVVPVNTAIGNQENVIPPNIASTTVDKRFGELSLVQNLDQSFTATGSITARDPVAINADGTVSTVSASVSNLNFIGIALASAADAASVTVRVHGTVTGFSGLTDGDLLFTETDGTLVQTKTTTALKVGVAVSATDALIFTTSNLDTYLLNIKKAELNDFSIAANASASGSGGLSYNNATGEFTLTPADTSTFATTSYVDTQVANLVDSAPASLDTLNELAAALNDDDNFATTVNDSIALKAPLASPALTGTPTAPTAATSTNTTQLATTAFVQSEISGLGNANLNSFSVTSNSASGGGSLAYNNANGVFTYTPPALFDGAFASLTSKPTTIAGYGITDAVPFASPTFTGTPAAPTASSGTNTTQIATTEFVQAAVTGGSGIALTDLSTSTLAASAGGALAYSNVTGVFTYTPPDLSSFTTFDGAFSSLTGKPTTISGYGITDAFDGAFSSLTGKPTTISGYGITDAFDGVFNSLTSKPTTVAGYGITDAFDGVFNSLTSKPTTVAGYGITDALNTSSNANIGSNDFITTGKSYYANMFAQVANLPSATTYHGMFAHVHATGAGYFAHGGNWIELANKSYVDSEIAALVDSAPGALDTLNELAAALNDDATFATTITTSLGLKAPLASPALTGVPTSPTAASGTNTTQVATTAFVTAAVAAGGGGGGGSSVTTDDTAPSSPSDGDLWYDTANGGMFVYYQDADSSQWVEVVGSQGPAGTDGGLDAWAEKTSAYTAVAGNRLIVDTSTAVTVTLPASASIGDEVRIIDGTGNAGTNNITIARNGHKIQGDASDLTISTDRAAFGLVYYNVANGWVLTER